MKRFHYTAVDAASAGVQGTIDAADWTAAQATLVARGLSYCQLVRTEELPRLSASDAVELAGYLSELARSGLPLAGSLRALAGDASSASLRKAIDDLSSRIESGHSLESALDSLSGRLPDHVRRLLVAAAGSGRLAQALDQLLAHERTMEDASRRFWRTVAYPSVLLVILVGWLLFVSWEVLPQFSQLFDDFQTDQPVVVTLADYIPMVLLSTVAGFILLVGLLAVIGGKRLLSRCLAAIPLIGPCWRNRGLMDFTGLVGEFIGEQIPLQEALEMTAQGSRDPAIRAACQQAAVQVAHGAPLSGAIAAHPQFPPTLVRWIQWGEARGALGGALSTARQMFEERFELRLQLARIVLPSVIFGLIAASAVTVASGIFGGLFTLIRDLSSSGPVSVLEKGQNYLLWAALALSILAATSWGVSRVLGRQNKLPEAILRLIAFTYFVFAMFCGLIGQFHVWGLFASVLILLTALRCLWRYWQSQRESLWAALTLAADCGTPLAPLASAFAEEHKGLVSVTASELALRLEAGATLPEAIAWTPWALPADAALVARIGSESGDLFGAMRAAMPHRAGGALLPPAILWLIIFVPASLFATVFIQLKIAPSMSRIFEDFDIVLPPLTTSAAQVMSSGLILPACLAICSLLLLGWLQRRGTMQPWLPGLKRVAQWTQLGPILRMLALVTRRGRPLPQALEAIALWHPSRWVRHEVRGAVRDMARGISWQECFRSRNLLAGEDLAVLAAAERNGNLAWAMDALGESYARRADYQLRAYGELLLPLVLVLVGLGVALFVIAYFVPLVYLVNALS